MLTAKLGEQLRAAYEADEAVQAVCDVLCTYQRGLLQIMTHRLCMHLDNAGYDLKRSQVIAVLRTLEQIGLGKYIEGRHGWKSRFSFNDGVTVVANLLESDGIVTIEEELDEEGAKSERIIEHTFNLRPDLIVSIELPADLSEFEAQRLSQFVGCLAFQPD